MAPTIEPGRRQLSEKSKGKSTRRPSVAADPNAHTRTSSARVSRPHRPHPTPSLGGGVNPLKRFKYALLRFLGDETRAGFLLIGAALVALMWANSPARHVFEEISHAKFGPDSLGMHLSVHAWAADGALTLFFFVVGLELKTEFVTGSLRDIREAALPMIAAAFGMVGPAVIYLGFQFATSSNTYHGWAIPTATDIAFAVALLGIFGKGLPPAARTFLLTLAVVDDLLAIIVIALFYSSSINFLALFGSLCVVAIFGFLTQKRILKWWLLVPLAIVAWGLMLNSGVHATIAGVTMGLLVPATRRKDEPQLTHRFVEMLAPWSAGLALPLFAFFAAGVNVVDGGGLLEVLTDPVSLGIMLGLPLGKCLGIWGSVAILTKLTPLRLGSGVDLPDIFAISLLAGIGFTVSLLVATLAFNDQPPHTDHARLAVILGTLLACLLGGIAVHLRVRTHVRGAAAQRG